jgi:hypothetical protein
MSDKPKSPKKEVKRAKSEERVAETTKKVLEDIRNRQSSDSNN